MLRRTIDAREGGILDELYRERECTRTAGCGVRVLARGTCLATVFGRGESAPVEWAYAWIAWVQA